ncbi:MAG: hypothetical protein ABH951_00275 [Patescibacteria group bacterium]
MADLNLIKVENKFENGSLDFLNPINWFRKKYTKDSVNILFIDDLDMPVVESLKKAHFKVKKVRDVKDVDDAEVKNAQIIFVDFDGVGKFVSPQHQGAGLVKELKIKYKSSKYVVFYTAQPNIPTDTIMSSMFNMADARMRKDSDVTDFTEQIREALKKLK